MNPHVKAWLLDLRQHQMWPELLKEFEAPRIPRYRRGKAAQVEEARADWIYQSGRRDQYEQFIQILTGAAPSDAPREGD